MFIKNLFNILFVFLVLFIYANRAVSEEIPSSFLRNMDIQSKISDIGLKLLNANKVDKHIIFVYTDNNKKPFIDKSLSKKEVVIYDKKLAFTSNEEEIAAMLALNIPKVVHSYKNFFIATQSKLAPKKFEILFDKKSVDYMVNAGYNPIAVITYMNKAYPQKLGFFFFKKNKISGRLANIYEYIYINYPYYLKNNPYIYTDSYQNFLLYSVENRTLLEKKIKSGSKKSLKYE